MLPLSGCTCKRYKGIPPTLGTLSLVLVEDCKRWMHANPLVYHDTARNGAQAVRMLAVVLKIWARFLARHPLPSNPLADLRTPPVDTPHRQPFTREEARRLVRAAAQGVNGTRDVALLLVLFDTGCRIGELMTAEVSDIDLSAGTIVFRHTKNRHARLVRFRIQDAPDGGPCVLALTRLPIRRTRRSYRPHRPSHDRLPKHAAGIDSLQ